MPESSGNTASSGSRRSTRALAFIILQPLDNLDMVCILQDPGGKGRSVTLPTFEARILLCKDHHGRAAPASTGSQGRSSLARRRLDHYNDFVI